MSATSKNGNGELRLDIGGARAAVAQPACEGLVDDEEGDCLRANEAAGVGTWRWDPQTSLVGLSGRSCQLMGLARATSNLSDFLACLNPEDRKTVDRGLRESADPSFILDIDVRTLSSASTVRRLRMVGKRSPRAGPEIEVCGILIGDRDALDVETTGHRQTERRLKDAQEMLIHVSRFTALGEMAYALAHEISQPLTAVACYLQGCKTLLSAAVPKDLAAVRDAVERAAEQGFRASRIIATLRDFTAPRATERSAEDLAALIDEACALALIGERNAGAAVSFAFDPGAGTVFVTKVQIQQVLLNLVRNAFEAMRNSPVRKLAVATRTIGTGMVEVRVADTGSGIEPEIAERLFQLFATTKRNGLGIGLSIARTIVEAHGGHLWAEIDPTGGSVIKFTIAAISPPEARL